MVEQAAPKEGESRIATERALEANGFPSNLQKVERLFAHGAWSKPEKNPRLETEAVARELRAPGPQTRVSILIGGSHWV